MTRAPRVVTMTKEERESFYGRRVRLNPYGNYFVEGTAKFLPEFANSAEAGYLDIETDKKTIAFTRDVSRVQVVE